MAAARPSAVRRDESSKLDTGAIAGIACAAGALFLGGIGLFLIYWRRQKQLERQDQLREIPIEENHLAAYSPPIYTHDYKIGQDSVVGGSGSSARTFSPEFPKEGVFYSPGEPTSVSAMPTHPAYIPRALVRQTPPSSQTIPIEEETPRPQIALQPAPKQRNKGTKSRPDDLVMQAFLRAADGERVPSEVFRLADNDEGGKDFHQQVPPTGPQMSTSSSLPLRNSPRNSPGRIQPAVASGLPAPGLATGTLTRPQPSPPRLAIETGHDRPPIAMRNGDMGISPPMNISPPLPNQQFTSPVEQREPGFGDKRTFRDRSNSNAGTGAAGHRRDNSTSRRIGDWIAGHPRQRTERYGPEEVPQESDVWG